MKRKEKISLIGEAIATIVATVAAGAVFWWLAKYSLLNERDIVGTTIIVWCVVVAKVLMWAEKEEEV